MELTCITCPKGCTLTIEMQAGKIVMIQGNSCPRGIEYAENEVLHPVRMLTSTVKINGGTISRCPVMTSKPIPKELMAEAMKEIESLTIEAPVACRDVLIDALCGLDVQLIATRSIMKES